MLAQSVQPNRPNWLMWGLMLVSIGIHVWIGLHLSGIYRSETLAVIELTLTDFSKPQKRSIPRPRRRPKTPPPVTQLDKVSVAQRPVPTLKPITAAAVETPLPDSLVEPVAVAESVSVPQTEISAWHPMPAAVSTPDFASAETYFEMVKNRIEQHKDYPENARSRQVEGRVTVGFVIDMAGSVKTVRIVKRSRSKSLDEAALNAVTRSSPFPIPPKHLFSQELNVKVTVVFELT